jgi:hypothetical protein
MTTIAHFYRLGFEGTDASLAVSLFEYRLIWRQIKRTHAKHRRDPVNYPVGEWEFVAPCLNRKGHYHYSWFKPDLDLKREFSWIKNWDGFLGWIGSEKFEEWNLFPLGWKISDLIGYYGQIEILGDDYGHGFPVRE